MMGEPEIHEEIRGGAQSGSLQEDSRGGVIPVKEIPAGVAEALGGICWAPYVGGPL